MLQPVLCPRASPCPCDILSQAWWHQEHSGCHRSQCSHQSPHAPGESWGASGEGTCSWALLRCPGEAHGASCTNFPFPFSFAQGTPLPPSAAVLLALVRAELLTQAAVKQHFSCSSSCILMPSLLWRFPPRMGCWEGCAGGEGKEPKVSAVGSQDMPQLPAGQQQKAGAAHCSGACLGLGTHLTTDPTDHINSHLWLRNWPWPTPAWSQPWEHCPGCGGGNGSQGSMRCP